MGIFSVTRMYAQRKMWGLTAVVASSFLGKRRPNPGISGSSCVTAALGNTWSHSVNTRLILQYLGSGRRQILIAKSPLATFTTFVYTIEKEGLVLQDQQRP
eukprot:bmy_07726T0